MGATNRRFVNAIYDGLVEEGYFTDVDTCTILVDGILMVTLQKTLIILPFLLVITASTHGSQENG